jgi:endonuclease YncB( thermonuclease family)
MIKFDIEKRPAKLLRVWDGDTIDMYVSLGLGYFCNARIRLLGVDAPEIFKVKKESEEFKAGTIALLEVRNWFNENLGLYYVNVLGRDLYGRWLGEIYSQNNNISLNEHMQKKFYGSSYFTWEHQRPLKDDVFINV